MFDILLSDIRFCHSGVGRNPGKKGCDASLFVNLAIQDKIFKKGGFAFENKKQRIF